MKLLPGYETFYLGAKLLLRERHFKNSDASLSKLSETNKIFVLHFFAAAKNQVKS
jgi:hypothetical protein